MNPELQIIINYWVVQCHTTYAAEHEKRSKYERKHDGGADVAKADFTKLAHFCAENLAVVGKG